MMAPGSLLTRAGRYTLALALIAGCSTGGRRPAELPDAMAEGEIQVSGVVRHSQVGVNCWRFEGGDGAGYELRPGQAPAALLTDGRRATLILRPRPDLMSTCMVGQIVDVVREVAGSSP